MPSHTPFSVGIGLAGGEPSAPLGRPAGAGFAPPPGCRLAVRIGAPASSCCRAFSTTSTASWRLGQIGSLDVPVRRHGHLAGGALGAWALALGAAGFASAILSTKAQDLAEGDAVGYPGMAGFELEDGIYLIAPITWLGWLEPFFVLCGIGASVYCLWTVWSLVKLRLTSRD